MGPLVRVYYCMPNFPVVFFQSSLSRLEKLGRDFEPKRRRDQWCLWRLEQWSSGVLLAETKIPQSWHCVLSFPPILSLLYPPGILAKTQAFPTSAGRRRYKKGKYLRGEGENWRGEFLSADVETPELRSKRACSTFKREKNNFIEPHCKFFLSSLSESPQWRRIPWWPQGPSLSTPFLSTHSLFCKKLSPDSWKSRSCIYVQHLLTAPITGLSSNNGGNKK